MTYTERTYRRGDPVSGARNRWPGVFPVLFKIVWLPVRLALFILFGLTREDGVDLRGHAERAIDPGDDEW